MKKLWNLSLSLLLLLMLAACGGGTGENQPGSQSGEQDTPAPPSYAQAMEKGAELAGELGLEGDGWLAADPETEPYGKYLTVAEWEAIFNGEASYDNAPAPVELAPPEPVAIGGVEGGYSGGTKTITFDENDLGENTDVEVWDWKAEMSPEELAEYEEFENTDWEAMRAELEAEMAGLGDMGGTDGDMGDIGGMPEMPDIDMEDLQQQIDTAMEQAREELANAELPEGYEQYLPEGFDFNSLFGGIA